MKKYNLEPKNDGCKSFYAKAKVIEEYNSISLISYNSCICQIQRDEDQEPTVKIYNVTDYYGKSLTFSHTSLRHLKEFLNQQGFGSLSKSDIMEQFIIVDGGQTDDWHRK